MRARSAGSPRAGGQRDVCVVWGCGPGAGTVVVHHGELLEGRFDDAPLGANGAFSQPGDVPRRLHLRLQADTLLPGAYATRICVTAATGSFTFWVRDVARQAPILLPPYRVAVTEGGDRRSYAEIVADVGALGLMTDLQRAAAAAETSYREAEEITRSVEQSILLGVSRDIRVFGMGFRDMPRSQINAHDDGTHGALQDRDWIQPQLHGYNMPFPGNDSRSGYFGFFVGRGWGAKHRIARRLDEDVLPILHAQIVDDDVQYDSTLFVAMEQSELLPDGVRGTDWLVADRYSPGHVFTAAQEQEALRREADELDRDEEPVACWRTVACNTAGVPRYAFFHSPQPGAEPGVKVPAHDYHGDEGWAVWSDSGQVFAVSRLNGQPLPQAQVAVLLAPGQAATLEFFLPHRPLPPERARALQMLDFDQRLTDCRAFWQQKLAEGAQLLLPEPRIDHQLKAGRLHLDLLLYGHEPAGALVPTIGQYPAFGSESAPIIRFLDSLGLHDQARRSLQFFLDKQQADGKMQNYGSVELETGCVLWLLGEHFRHTADRAWVQQIRPQLELACDYLQTQLRAERREELRGRGFGMLPGPVADDPDAERYFMNSGYAYLGLLRAAEMLADIDPQRSGELRAEADELRGDLRRAIHESLAAGPVVPLGDGTWSPAAAAWPGYAGPLFLAADGGEWYTHMAFTFRDSMNGPLYLVFQEVLEPDELAATQLLNVHRELMCTANVAFAQPYYSRHPFVHLRRGEVNAFLEAFYNGLAGLADRQTTTFSEIFVTPNYKPHKTHEEAWFLMQARWMLYLEEDDTLRLLPGVPRAWLQAGKSIVLDRVSSYFGPVTLEVHSRLDQGQIVATVECLASDRRPRRVALRLPHPAAIAPARVDGGEYDRASETVLVEGGRHEVVLHFESPS